MEFDEMSIRWNKLPSYCEKLSVLFDISKLGFSKGVLTI